MRYLILGLLVFVNTCLYGINKEVFRQLISEPPPAWMVEQIQGDLESFSTELSREALDQLFTEKGEEATLTRVQIKNGKLRFYPTNKAKSYDSVTPWLVQGFRRLGGLVRLPDVDFVFTSEDMIDTINNVDIYGELKNWPIFVEAKNSPTPGFLFPDRWALRGYVPEKTDMMAGNQIYPWESKIPILFFRGSDTCRDFWKNGSRWDDYPRVKFVRLSNQYPEYIDAKFFGRSLHTPSKLEQARSEGLITEVFVPHVEHPRYKYLMDLDGNCASCPRTAAIFHSNSVIFKEVSPSKQWWYGVLKPYVHYIPVAGDFSDVISQIEWAKSHDEECKKISENAQQLVLDVLSEERIYQFLYELIKAYAEKQKKYY